MLMSYAYNRAKKARRHASPNRKFKHGHGMQRHVRRLTFEQKMQMMFDRRPR